ncbi:MAG: hypothetical protein AAGD32_16335 [Planctomycetota bacterium]
MSLPVATAGLGVTIGSPIEATGPVIFQSSFLPPAEDFLAGSLLIGGLGPTDIVFPLEGGPGEMHYEIALTALNAGIEPWTNLWFEWGDGKGDDFVPGGAQAVFDDRDPATFPIDNVDFEQITLIGITAAELSRPVAPLGIGTGLSTTARILATFTLDGVASDYATLRVTTAVPEPQALGALACILGTLRRRQR